MRYRMRHYRVYLSTDKAAWQEAVEQVKASHDLVDKGIEAYAKTVYLPEDRKLTDAMKVAFEEYVSLSEEWISLVNAGKIEESKTLMSTKIVACAKDRLEPSFNAVFEF